MAKTLEKRYLPLKLLSLETEGFSFFPRQEVILHAGITVLNGENGSGKTTFLNMLRVLFGATRFDNGHTLKTFFERKDSHEIYVIGRFDNQRLEAYDRQPFEGIGKTKDVVSVVCRLLNDQPVRRDYVIFDGVFELDVHAKGGLRWLESGQYLQQMSEVGLSKALVNAFSFNQGHTEKLLDKNEEELADYLLHICGEQERMERFEQIKQALQEQMARFAQLQELKRQDEAQLQRIADKMQRCKQIVEKKEQLDKLRFDEPLARCREHMRGLEAQTRELQRLDVALLEAENLCRQRQQVYTDQDQLHNEIVELLRQVTAALVRLRSEREQLQERLGPLQHEVIELETFVRTYEGIAELPLEQVAAELTGCEQAYEAGLAERAHLQSQRRKLEEQIAFIRKHHAIVYPPAVQRMLQQLKEAGIEHVLLAECVEIKDAVWREAIEALLGTERFTITVAEPHMVQVMRMAQQLKYPFWISPFKVVELTADPASVVAQLDIRDPRLTGYIAKFQNYMLAASMEEAWAWIGRGRQALLHHPHPYKVVERGGKWMDAHGLYCGKQAYEWQLRQLEEERQALLPACEQAERAVTSSKQAMEQAEQHVHVQQQVRQLPAKAKRLREAADASARLVQEQDELTARIALQDKDKEQLHRRDSQLQHELGQLTAELKHLERGLADGRRNKAVLETTLGSGQEQLEQMKLKLSESQRFKLCEPAYLEQLYAPDYYAPQLRLLQSIIDTFRGQGPDAIAPGEETKTLALETKYAAHQRMLEQHQQEIEQAQDELEQLEHKHREAEAEYRYMVEDVFAKIRRSLEELTRHTNMHVSLRALHIGDQRWRVEYRIGFHGKIPSSYRNKSDFSGGQKVIASLLLTFAAVKADGVLSFMVLDEPFAHLDHERIKLVGDFLKKSEVQYMIAMPYTENLKLVMPWVDMLLNLRPKSSDAELAPPFTYGGIDEGYVERHSLYPSGT